MLNMLMSPQEVLVIVILTAVVVYFAVRRKK
jgi:hypothetical protein